MLNQKKFFIWKIIRFLFGSNMKKYGGADRCIFQQYQFRPLLR